MEEPVTRDEHLAKAEAAAKQAADLAADADRYAHSFEGRTKVPLLAAAGALWADVARAHAAIADVLPETEDTRG
jgi:hypothetical protein